LIWTPDGQRLLAGISDFNSTLTQIVLAPPPCVNLQSPWPRLGRKRGSFGGSADRPGLLHGSTTALPHGRITQRPVRCLSWSLPVRHRQRRDPSQHPAKTLLREMSFRQQQPVMARVFDQPSAQPSSLHHLATSLTWNSLSTSYFELAEQLTRLCAWLMHAGPLTRDKTHV
jgi:hypothetical protein